MNGKFMLCGLSCLFAAAVAHATSIIIVGEPGNNLRSTPTKPTPSLGAGATLLNFDSLTAFDGYSTYSASGVSIYSPDTFQVLPYSTQSGPNELYDNSADGSAYITISLTRGVYSIGIGIADSDPVTLSVQALGAGGLKLGLPFLENLSATESSINTGNGYYIVSDTISDIYGLQITQAVGNANYSGLAIDDVQVQPVPEPSTLSLLAGGLSTLSAFGAFRKLQRAQAPHLPE